MMGIYCFTNKVNGKKYVGQSLSIESRFNGHKHCHLNPSYKGYDTKFYRALRKYGFENFELSILEECPKEKLNERERYFISLLDSFRNGYNSSIGGEVVANGSGESHHQAVLTEKEILEIKELLLKGELLYKERLQPYTILLSQTSLRLT